MFDAVPKKATGFGSFKIQQVEKSSEVKKEIEANKPLGNSFGNYQIKKKPEPVKSETQEIQDNIDKRTKITGNPLQKLFNDCLSDVINKRQSSICVDVSEVKRPDNFI